MIYFGVGPTAYSGLSFIGSEFATICIIALSHMRLCVTFANYP
jgi:hypothetical protein